MRERPAIGIPLSKCGRLPGDVGAGPSAPGFLATDAGVVVTRRGRISLHTADLLSELWRVPVDDWSNDTLVAGDALYCGVIEDQIKEFSLRDGSVRRSFTYEAGRIMALQNDICILTRPGCVDAVDWSGQRRWTVKIAGGLDAHGNGRLYASADEPFRRALVCINTLTGEVAWKRELPAEGRGDAAMLSHKISSVSVLEERVLVIPQDRRRLFLLSSKTGEIESITPLPRLPTRGECLVTDNEVICFHPYGVAFFDHREMRETKRIDLRADVEPLYQGKPPYSYGACLTQEGAIWTAPHGAFMGVDFEPGPDGRRLSWVEEIPDALIPRGTPPVVHNGYMYYTNMGERLELMCYVSAALAR